MTPTPNGPDGQAKTATITDAPTFTAPATGRDLFAEVRLLEHALKGRHGLISECTEGKNPPDEMHCCVSHLAYLDVQKELDGLQVELAHERQRVKELEAQLLHEHAFDVAVDGFAADCKVPWPVQKLPTGPEAFEHFKKQTVEPSDSAIRLAKFVPLDVQMVSMNRGVSIVLFQWVDALRQRVAALEAELKASKGELALEKLASATEKHACETVEAAYRDLQAATDLVATQIESGADDCIRECERADKAEASLAAALSACAKLEAANATLRQALKSSRAELLRQRDVWTGSKNDSWAIAAIDTEVRRIDKALDAARLDAAKEQA